jgi:hypothetical protein
MDEIAAECAALRMQAALAEERASAMQVVMAEQESAIAEGASALGDEALGEDAGAEGAARSTASFALSQLLQRWRYKVFDLLMQSSHAEQQSTAALQRKEAHVATLNQRLASQQVEIEALQLQLHQSAIAASQQVRCVGVLTHSHTPPSIRRPTPLHTFLLAPHANETSHRAFPPMCSHHTLTHPPSPRIYVQRAIANDAEIARSAERELHRVQYEHREAKLMRERRARQIVESTVRSCVANASTRVEGTHDSLQQGLSRLEAYALRLAKFAKLEILAGHPPARLWTSSLKRTIQTGRHIEHTTLPDGWVTMRPKVWRAMDELCELLCVCVQNLNLNLNEQQLRLLSLFLSPHPSPRHCNDAFRVSSSLLLQMLACSTE